MPVKRQPARRTAPARRRKPSARKHPVRRKRIPRGGPLHARLTAKMVIFAVSHLDDHGDTVRSRKDAAILRATHQGCPKCGGNGQIFTKGKDGSFTGSKPCPAKPTREKVSKWQVYKASRFGADKRTGLVGWSCPCGKKAKPRFRDAKEATKALRTHERTKHGGKSVGGTWYAQAAGTPAAQPADAKKTTQKRPASGRKATPMRGDLSNHEVGRPKEWLPYDPTDPSMEHRRKPFAGIPDEKNQHSGLTDYEWVTQDKDRSVLPGECPRCKGTSMIFALNADATTDYERQIVVTCPNRECHGGRVASR